jgi:hypothetical protein
LRQNRQDQAPDRNVASLTYYGHRQAAYCFVSNACNRHELLLQTIRPTSLQFAFRQIVSVRLVRSRLVSSKNPLFSKNCLTSIKRLPSMPSSC